MPPLAAAPSSTSRCGLFASRGGGGSAEQSARAHAAATAPASGHGCGRPLGRAAGLVGGGIAAAFFASLERCACVEVRTTDDLADCPEATPLMQLDDGNRAAGTKQSRRRTAARAGAGRGSRAGGSGCCENIN